MSDSDRVALAHVMLREFNDRDVDRFAERFARDAEWLPLRSATEGAYRGPAGVRKWFQETEELFDYIRAELDEVEVRGNVVVGTGSLNLRGKGSGATVELPITWIFRLDGDTVVRGGAFSDPDEALASLV